MSYKSAASLLTELGMEAELLRAKKTSEQKLSIYSVCPTGLLKVYYLKAVSEELIVLIGVANDLETYHYVTPATLQLSVRLEPKEPGEQEKSIKIEGFSSNG